MVVEAKVGNYYPESAVLIKTDHKKEFHIEDMVTQPDGEGKVLIPIWNSSSSCILMKSSAAVVFVMKPMRGKY